jgi:hypothetical protein
METLLQSNKIGVASALALAITFYTELFGNIKGRVGTVMLTLILCAISGLLFYSSQSNGAFILVLVIFMFSTRSLFVKYIY